MGGQKGRYLGEGVDKTGRYVEGGHVGTAVLGRRRRTSVKPTLIGRPTALQSMPFLVVHISISGCMHPSFRTILFLTKQAKLKIT